MDYAKINPFKTSTYTLKSTLTIFGNDRLWFMVFGQRPVIFFYAYDPIMIWIFYLLHSCKIRYYETASWHSIIWCSHWGDAFIGFWLWNKFLSPYFLFLMSIFVIFCHWHLLLKKLIEQYAFCSIFIVRPV